uniref:Odorant receptor n=1 Tax=Conopomorpha sinensis TaxID=940481 RepID=A0A3Q8HE76_9NEOP|nr:putative odorant receptor 8 [Conopomorpha sinensis]
MIAYYNAFHRILSLVGISFFAEHNWDSNVWLFWQITNVFIGFLTFIFPVAFCIVNFTNLPMFIAGACIWITGLVLFISLCICLFFRRSMRQYLHEMGFKDALLEMPLVGAVMARTVKGQHLIELKKMVQETQKFFMRMPVLILKMYMTHVFVTATLYLLGGLYLAVTRENREDRILPFEMWFPWSLEDYRVYIATFLFQVYEGYLTCIAYAGFQSTLVLLNGQVIRQLRILQHILKHIDVLSEDMVDEGLGREWQGTCTDLLTQCVKHYMKLKSFSNRLNTICRPFYLVMILDATMLVCVCSVKIAISDKLSSDVIKYYLHEVCFVMIVMIFCFLGQQIENECEELEEAVTEKWYVFDLRHRRHLIIFKVALGQRMPIIIFGSVTLSLPTFTWFIKTGASFFTFVMTFLEHE